MKNGNCKIELFFLVAKVVNVQEMDNAEQKGIFLFFFFFLNQVTPIPFCVVICFIGVYISGQWRVITWCREGIEFIIKGSGQTESMSSHMRFNNASARSQKKQAVPQAWKRESGKLPSRNGAGNAGWQHQMPCTAFLPTWARCHVTSSWLLTSTHKSHPGEQLSSHSTLRLQQCMGFFCKTATILSYTCFLPSRTAFKWHRNKHTVTQLLGMFSSSFCFSIQQFCLS